METVGIIFSKKKEILDVWKSIASFQSYDRSPDSLADGQTLNHFFRSPGASHPIFVFS